MKKNTLDKIFKILLVEDDTVACDLIKCILLKENYVVSFLVCGEHVLDEIRIFQPDLLILDMDLPDITGWDLLRIVRSDRFLFSLMILAISGKYAHTLHTIRALGEFGADDYLPKPFGNQLLLSHVKALLRRKHWDTENELRTLRNGPISLDVASRQAFFNGKHIHLTSSEFKVLLELLRNKGKALDRNHLSESIMGYSSGVYDVRSVDKHVESIRRKLPHCSKRIVTVRDFGYKFFVLMFIIFSQFTFLYAGKSGYVEKADKFIKILEANQIDSRSIKSLGRSPAKLVKRGSCSKKYWESSPAKLVKRGRNAAASLVSVVKKIIFSEISERKNEAGGIMRQAGQKVKKIYSSAVDNYNGKKYLFASDEFKCIMAYKPHDSEVKEYLYKIHSEMSALSSCEVVPDAEKLAYAKGFMYYNSGELVNAVSEWERVMGINPANQEVKHYVDKTRRFLKEMIERERFERLKSMTHAVYERACNEYSLGNYGRAIEKWEKVIIVSQKEKSNYFEELLKKSRNNISRAMMKMSKNGGRKEADMLVKDVAVSEKYYKEGLEMYSLGRVRDAITRWNLSIRFNPLNEKAVKAKDGAVKEMGMDSE